MQDFALFFQVLLVLSGIVRCREGSKKHLDDLVHNGDFPVLHCLDIGSSVSGIRSDHISQHMSKIQLMSNLWCLVVTQQEPNIRVESSLKGLHLLACSLACKYQIRVDVDGNGSGKPLRSLPYGNNFSHRSFYSTGQIYFIYFKYTNFEYFQCHKWPCLGQWWQVSGRIISWYS